MDASELNGLPETAYADTDATDAPDDNGLLDDDDTRLIELVGFLVQGIVTYPEEVEVEEFYDEVGMVYACIPRISGGLSAKKAGSPTPCAIWSKPPPPKSVRMSRSRF
jgi:hypothetical protein